VVQQARLLYQAAHQEEDGLARHRCAGAAGEERVRVAAECDQAVDQGLGYLDGWVVSVASRAFLTSEKIPAASIGTVVVRPPEDVPRVAVVAARAVLGKSPALARRTWAEGEQAATAYEAELAAVLAAT
jgi:hypothetical protein